MSWFRHWRRARVLRHATLDARLWQTTIERYPFTRVLTTAERARLRELVILFLDEKAVQGAGGMAVKDDVRLAIAVQACVLVLNLGLDCYRGWVEVIVYPDEFVAEYDYVDEAGVVHHVEQPMSGESWAGGPVVISWADVQEAGTGGGYNVVIHEFAHKLDMLNGAPNGFPPLPADMSRAEWAAAFTSAYEDFCRKVDDWNDLPIDEYAAENPAEFFAVLSEAFFESPLVVRGMYPDVYTQLTRFYRQDPAARVAGKEPSAESLQALS